MKIIVDAEGRRVELDDGVTFAVTMAAAPSTASGNVTTGPTAEYLEAHQRIALAMWRETAPSHRQPAGFSAPAYPPTQPAPATCWSCGKPAGQPHTGSCEIAPHMIDALIDPAQ